jgi:hypothetical protein
LGKLRAGVLAALPEGAATCAFSGEVVSNGSSRRKAVETKLAI